jgi:hypothetical protein
MPPGPHILRHVEDALSDCFAFHRDLDVFVQRVGLPTARLAAARARADQRNNRWPKTPKRYVAQEIIEELRSGSPDDDRLLSQLIDSLCRTFQDDQSPGGSAVSALRQERERDAKLASEERAARQKSAQTSLNERDRAAARKIADRDSLKMRYLQLAMNNNYQERGYLLESLLRDLLILDGLNPRESFRNNGEQIDGAFAWSGRTHLLEAKWTASQVDGKEFGAFNFKIDGKTVDTRGLFCSINGHTVPAISALNGKGALRFVCIDGSHLMRALEPGWSLTKILEVVWRHADETGESYLPVSHYRFVSMT